MIDESGDLGSEATDRNSAPGAGDKEIVHLFHLPSKGLDDI